ncbi:MAG: ABC transporter ATP-binding protein, partial [Eubacterium sp.]|nr:ABC transporter ATP-binding protein [Eubacterium sp.]
DRYFIHKTATRILDLTNQKLLSYDGNYEYYLEKKETVERIHFSDADTDSPSIKKETESKLDWKAQKELDAKKRKLQNASKQAEETIARLEEEIHEIDAEFALPENATNVGRLTELTRLKEEKETTLTDTMDQWEQLMEELESL